MSGITENQKRRRFWKDGPPVPSFYRVVVYVLDTRPGALEGQTDTDGDTHTHIHTHILSPSRNLQMNGGSHTNAQKL